MAASYKTVYQGGQGEIVEKKSRFIATVEPVHSEEEALAFLECIKKKYWDASHNCSAYVIGKDQCLKRYSDDGEPGGTAGRPILEVLQGAELCDTAVVVTRYFGGTLLGTGGLVRAYTKAAQEGIARSVVIEKIPARRLRVGTDYNSIGKIQYLLGQAGISILDSQYTDTVSLEILIPLSQEEEIRERLTEGTSGKALLEPLNTCWYARSQGQLLLFGEETP